MLNELFYWIREREAIRKLKESGAPRPWTEDIILRQYRFCNVRREDDRVTLWVAENWRTPFRDQKDIWFFMMLARLLNLPESLALLPTPSSKWDAGKFVKALHDHAAAGGKVFNAAYIVSTAGKSVDKVEYLAEEVLGPAWAARETIRPRPGDTLASFAERLLTCNGMAGFMTGQVVADVKYTAAFMDDKGRPTAKDWMTFAVSGPGSRRGLNRMTGQPVDKSWNEAVWHETLMDLQSSVNLALHEELGFKIHAQDMQNCLCEFDKYCRVKNGEGTPKQLYKPFTAKKSKTTKKESK